MTTSKPASAPNVKRVRQLVRRGIANRCGWVPPESVRHLEQHDGSVFVHVNSGGNALAAMAEMRLDGYDTVEVPAPDDRGVAFLVTAQKPDPTAPEMTSSDVASGRPE